MFDKICIENLRKEIRRLNLLSLIRYAFIFLLISLLIWAFFFHNFRTVALMNIADLNNAYAKQTELIAGSIDNMVRTFGTHVYQSESCKVLRSPTRHSNSEVIYALREISEYASSSEFIESINIYNPTLDKIYTTSPLMLSVDGVLPEEFTELDVKRLYDEFNSTSYIQTHFNRNEETGLIDGVYYLFFDTSHKIDSGASLLILKIFPKWYLGKLTTMGTGSDLILIDNQNRLVYSTFPFNSSYSRIFQTSEGDGYITANIGNVKKVFFLSEFKPLGWKIVSVMDEKDCLGHLYRLRNSVTLIFSIVSFILVLLLLLIFIFVYDPYTRIRHKLHDINPELEDKSPLSEDEILTAIIDENVSNKYVTDFGLLLGGDKVVLEGFTPPYVLGITTKHDQNEIRKILEPVCSNLVITDYIHEGNVFLSCPREDISEDVTPDIMVKDGAFLALSHPYSDISETSEHYRRLSELISIKFTIEDNIVYEDELDSRTTDITDEDNLLESIFSLLKSRKSEEALDAYNRYFNAFSSFDALSIQHSLKNLEIELEKCAKELNLDFSPTLPDVDEQMRDAESMKDIQDRYLPFIIQIENGYKLIRQATDSRIAMQIESILNKNYRRYDFTTIELSESIGRNLNYLSKVYKETYGISITNSIMKKRAETAKTLLESTDANVEDIAVKLGFENIKYFYVIFKKFVGVTPLQYRKNIRK